MTRKTMISRHRRSNRRLLIDMAVWKSCGLITLILLTVQIVCICGFAIDQWNPNVLLDSLSPEELDFLFEDFVMDMEKEIIEIYERHLQNFHESVREMENLGRSRREALDSAPHVPEFQDNFWHSADAEIKLDNREILKIESITVDHILGDVQIDKAFSLNLWNLPAIYLDGNGTAMVIKEMKLVPLLVRNAYTKSLKGCVCADSISMACACCVPDACLCKEVEGYFGNVCLPCGQEKNQTACTAASPYVLKTDAVVGFEYSLDIYDPVEGLQRVIISSNETTIFFYKYDEDGLRPVHFENGMTIMSFAQPISHLGFGETYTDVHGSIQRKRFLVAFGAGKTLHQFHELDVTSHKLKSGPSIMWEAAGQEMKVWNSGGRVMVGVLSGLDLLIHQMKENHLHEYHLMYTQTISCDSPVSSWKSFSMNFEDYIMLVSASHAQFYHQNGIHYRYLQELHLNDGISAFKDIVYFYIPNCRDKGVFLTGEGKTLSAYVWNGTAQQIQKTYTTNLSVNVTKWSAVHAHVDRAGFGPLQVVAPVTMGAISLDINATLEELPDPVVLHTRALHKRIQDLEDEYQRQNAIIEKFLDRVNNSVEGKSEITGPITVLEGISAEGRLESGELKKKSVLLHHVTPDGKNINIDYIEHLEEHKKLDELFTDLHNQMNSSFVNLQDVVLKDDDGTRVITGKKTLLGKLSSDTVTVGKFSYESAKDGDGQSIQLDKILSDVIRYNDTRQIGGQKTFTKLLQTGNLQTEFLDDIPVSDIVTTTENETVIAGATFSTLNAEAIYLPKGAVIGGINVSSLPTVNETFALGHCAFLSNLTAREVLSKLNNINGVNIEYLNISSLKTKGGTVKGPIEFVNDLKAQKTEAKALMGVDTAKYMAETVFTDQSADILGTLNLHGLEVKSDMSVFGSINGRKFPDSYAILSERVIPFVSKRFEHLRVDSVLTDSRAKVDNLLVEDIVTLDTEQQISGEKHFLGGITILGNLDIKSKIIDGVHLDEFNASIHDPRLTKNKKFDVIFKGNLSVPSIQFNGTLNDLNFRAFAEDIVYDDESPLIINSPKTFASGLKVAKAILESTLNGEDIKKLITLNKEQIITGEKIFQNVLSFTNITVSGLVDGIRLNEFDANVLYLDRPGQTITGNKTFADAVFTREFAVEGTVNGVDFRKVATRDGTQNFTASQTITHGKLDALKANLFEMDFPVFINGFNFSDIFEKRLSLSSSFNHSGKLTVNATVTVNNSLFVDFVNGKKLGPLLENIVLTSEPSVLKSIVTFANITAYGPITSKNSKGANDISIREIGANAVHLNSDSALTDETQWEQMELEGGVVGTGLFSGYDIGELSREAVFTDIPGQSITGEKTFVSNVIIMGNLNAETVNGIDLQKRLFSRSTQQTIQAPISFSDFIAQKNVNIIGKFNDVDMKFTNADLFKESAITFRGNVAFHNNITASHLKIGHFLDDIHVEKFLKDAVKTTDDKIEITGEKILTQDPHMPNTEVKSLNGINFTEYMEHILLLNALKNLTGTVTINGSLTMPEVLATNLVVEGSVDDVDIKELEQKVLYLHEDRIANVSVEIRGQVYIGGDMNVSFLNGHNIEKDYLTLDTKQIILHNATFENIWTSDVSVLGFVNSWNLPYEVQDTLKTSGGQTITGMKTFTGPLKVLGNLEVRGKVGSDRKVKLASQAIRLEEEQIEIEGLLVFNQTVKVKRLSSSTNIINGVNYTELCENAWILSQPATVTGRMVFEADSIFMRGLFYNTSDGTPSIGDVQRENLVLSDERFKGSFELNKNYSRACDSITSLHRKLENAIYEGDFIDIVGMEGKRHRLSSATSFQVFNTTYIAMSWESADCQSTLYKLNPETSQLVELITLADSGYGKQWLFIENGKNTYLALANTQENNPCPRANSTIWKWDDEDTLIVHQHLEPGEGLAATYSGVGGVKIFLQAAHHTTTYKLNPSTQLFERYKGTSEVVDISFSLHMQDKKTSILFQAHKGSGKVVINGKSGSKEELARNILDAVLFEQRKKVFLVISSVTLIRQRAEHEIKLFSVDLLNKSFRWLDHQQMASPANLTSFYAGNRVTGTTYIIVSQHNRFPLVYTLLGEKLQLFTELDIPRVEWVEYMGVPGQRYQTFPEHYILFGQKDNTQLLTQLIMKGASAPAGNTAEPDCNIQYLSTAQLP